MKLSFCSLSSGSSGNCYIVRTENTVLIIDAGISGKRVFMGLAALGINYEDVNGVLITHEHIDHIKSVQILAKKFENAKVYASKGTWEATGDLCSKLSSAKYREINEQRIFTIGDITVITEEIHEAVKDSELLVIESNYDVHMLEFCRYPYNVKRRILGDFGHLSNDAAAEEICRICKETGQHREVLLAHLSKENNFPEMAYQTVKNLLEEHEIYIGKHLNLHIMARNELSPVFTLGE